MTLNRCQVYSPKKHFFRYYSKGDEQSPVVILIPPITGTPEAFYRQFSDLPNRGYYVIAVLFSVYCEYIS
jgi:dienelactone hydrolase